MYLDKSNVVFPVIVSASRRTDIPAFYSDWFMNVLKNGYVKWRNPFNGKTSYVSFKNTRLIVFWSKNPQPLFKYLKEIEKREINYYFQFTLNDYEEENLEPHLPPLKSRIETFKTLSDLIGKEKVIWRFDPLILTDKIDIKKLLDKIYNVGDKINRYTEKLVISFIDVEKYDKVKRNMKKHNIFYKKFETQDIEKIAGEIAQMNNNWKLQIATCAESFDLTKYGIGHNKCIDDGIIIKLFRNDMPLMNFLGFKIHGLLFERKKVNLKDKGQRKECGCIVSKDIGQYNTCNHLCVYCYANR